MFFNLVLPTSVGGDMVRVWYLCRQPGPAPAHGRRTAALVSVLADRANGLAVLVALATLAALLCPLSLPAWITGSVYGMAVATLAGLGLMPLLPRLRRYLPDRDRLQRLLHGATLCWQARDVMIAITLLSVLVQGANVVLGWLLGEAIGLPVPALYYGVLISLVSLLTMLPISVNGMGVREASTVLLLAPLGVSSAQAVTLSLLLFTVYTAASLAGCGFYLFGRLPRFQARAAGADTEASDHAESVRGHSHQGRAGQPPAAA
jgi:uncharacterized membrane protein YbhN (UPF0104 family)